MSIFSDYTSFINDALVKLVSFVTIIIIGFVIGRFFGKLCYKILNELEIDSILTKRLNATVDIERIAGKSVQYVIYLVSLIYALNKIGVPLDIFYYLFLVVFFVFIVFLILETKDYLYNLFIGTFFINKKFLKLGQKIKIKDIEGVIVKITATEIKIITPDNDTFFVPNAVLKKSSLFKKVNNKEIKEYPT
ncbi:mechanosensitive ion channel [Candidatus Woesearchaeota archaeon]|nr:mechanosensitive ion channel [Candidatus Woesearchaeota archaeon]